MYDLNAINTSTLPIVALTEELQEHVICKTVNHFHTDIEIIHILSGSMTYYINGEAIHVKSDDILFINSSQLHNAMLTTSPYCQFNFVLISPSIITDNTWLSKKYMEPFLNTSQYHYQHVSASDLYHQELHYAIDTMVACKQSAAPGSDLDLLGQAYMLMKYIYLLYEKHLPSTSTMDKDLPLQNLMLQYIYQQYRQKLTLHDIAAAGNVSPSSCCKIFKKYVHQSPMVYVNQYRLQMACHLLITTDYPITDIAYQCGFNQPSYFNKLFFKTYHCTPTHYRQRANYVY
ncbi:AraC family transcriptional regulator [Veillonella montpellierensis]|uniref:AraC family transcriptional regulator n=1 Tax=Veillonella montpellierensis TaxID=187328 RepID=UPI0023FA1420|nr:AraC family transcriptional regulator [Veillonella montpellierensis]